MAIAIPEAQIGKSSTAITTLATGTFATSPNAGDLIVVHAVTYIASGSAGHIAPVDTAGNSFTQIGTTLSSNSAADALESSIWIKENLPVGSGLGSYSVSGKCTNAAVMVVVAVRVTGQKTPTSSNADTVGTAVNTGAGTANPHSGVSTPAPAANSIFFGCMTDWSTETVTDGTNVAWTHIANERLVDNVTFLTNVVEHFVQAAATVLEAQFTATSDGWNARVASFAPAVSANRFFLMGRH